MTIWLSRKLAKRENQLRNPVSAAKTKIGFFHIFIFICSSLWCLYIFSYMDSLSFVKEPLELSIYQIFAQVNQKIFLYVSKTHHRKNWNFKHFLAPPRAHTPVPIYWWSSSTDHFFRITPGPRLKIALQGAFLGRAILIFTCTLHRSYRGRTD